MLIVKWKLVWFHIKRFICSTLARDFVQFKILAHRVFEFDTPASQYRFYTVIGSFELAGVIECRLATALYRQ